MTHSLGEHSCLRKTRHNTQARALRAAARAAGRAQLRNLGVYRCHHCGGWHLMRKAPNRG